ncbi:MAG: ABC transporter permease, partial [Pseudomonadota bacterium]
APPPAKKGLFTLDPLSRRRWASFKANRRGFWSFRIFLALFALALAAPLVANDKPLWVTYRGDVLFPIWQFHPETRFNGDFETEADYRSVEVRCLIVTGGLDACFDDPDGLIEAVAAGEAPEGATPGAMTWPLIPFSYDTINRDVPFAPSPPDASNWLGTDDQARDVLARV